MLYVHDFMEIQDFRFFELLSVHAIAYKLIRSRLINKSLLRSQKYFTENSLNASSKAFKSEIFKIPPSNMQNRLHP